MLSPSSAVVTWTAGSLGLYLCTNVMHKNCLNSGASLDPPSFSRRIYDNKEIYNISVWVFHPVSKAMKVHPKPESYQDAMNILDL